MTLREEGIRKAHIVCNIGKLFCYLNIYKKKAKKTSPDPIWEILSAALDRTPVKEVYYLQLADCAMAFDQCVC